MPAKKPGAATAKYGRPGHRLEGTATGVRLGPTLRSRFSSCRKQETQKVRGMDGDWSNKSRVDWLWFVEGAKRSSASPELRTDTHYYVSRPTDAAFALSGRHASGFFLEWCCRGQVSYLPQSSRTWSSTSTHACGCR